MSLKLPEFVDIGYMNVSRMSALGTDGLYLPKIFLAPTSVRGWVDTRVIVRLEGLTLWRLTTPIWFVPHR